MTTKADERLARIEDAIARLETLGLTTPGTPTTSSVNPDGSPGPVAPGELIESAWGNATSNSITERRKLGIVPDGRKIMAGSQGAITSITDLTGLSISFTPEVGRLYMARFEAQALSSAAQMATFYIASTAGTVYVERTWFLASNGQTSQYVGVSSVLAGMSGTVTLKVRAAATGGTGPIQISVSASSIAEFTVEDVGPTR